MKSKLLTALGLILFTVIIVLPPLIHGYIYPNLGDDSAEHIKVFELMRAGQPYELRYLGYAIVGYPLVWINQLTHVSLPMLYLWFCYASLIGVGLSLYLVTSSIVNRVAGWLSLLIVLWCAQGIFFQFYFGQIFNLINMGIILPWLLYFAIKQEKQNGLYALFGLSFLFGAFHSTGIYAPIVCVLGIIATVIYVHTTKTKSDKWVDVLLPLIIVFLSSFVGWVIFSFHSASIGSLGDMKIADINLQSFMLDIISPSVILLAVFSAVFWKDILRNCLVVALFGLSIVLFLSVVTRITSDPFRQSLDFAIVFSWLIAILVGHFLSVHKKNIAMVGIIGGVIAVGCVHNIPTWFSYTSAVREPDKQAIEYLNSQNVSTYNADLDLAYWVYDRLTTVKYTSNELAPFIIMRNKPMTPRSDPENKWYTPVKMPQSDIDPIELYKPIATFSDDKVALVIWGVK